MVNSSPYQVHKGYLVSQGTLNNSFVIAKYNPTQLVGVLKESTLPNQHGEVATSGVVKVHIADSVQRGDQVRAIKSGDMGYQGQAVRVKTGDTDYFLVGEVLQSGTGLLDVSLRLQYVGQGNGNPTSSGITDVYAVDDDSLPLEYIKKVKNGETSTVTQLVKPSGLVWGGNVSVQSGLTLNVRKAIYYILKNFYTSSDTTVTLQDADPTHPRIDVIAGNTSGQVIVLTGVPSENPVKPQVDPDTQTEFTYVLLEAGATSPSGSLTELIYDENSAGEWVCAGANSYSLKKPLNGFYCTELSSITTGEIFTYTKGATVAIGDYSQLVLNLCLKAIMASTQNIYVSLWNGTTQVGSEQPLVFDKASLVYQLITVDVSKFGATGNIDRVRFRHTNTAKRVGTHLGFYMDVIKLEAINTPVIDYVWHFGTTTSSGITQIPVTNGRRIHFAQGTNVTLEVQEHATLGHLVTINSTSASAYIYIAYASAIDGTGFTLTNDPALDYMAILSSPVAIPSPVVGDFAGLWYKRVGEDGQGVPAGGTTGQKLVKHSNTDYDTEWKDDLSIFDIEFEYADISSRTAAYVLDLKASFAYTILSAVLVTDAGTCTASFKIDGTNITSLSAVGATTTITETNATGANTVTAGQLVTLTVTSVVTATRLAGKLKIQR